MKRRNLLAILSTVSVLLASTPLLWLQADTAPAMKRMEAETSASLNLYCNLEDGGSGKVVGGSVGLSPLWTLLAALLGGKLFGIIGIVFFIPLAAVISQLLQGDIEHRLAAREKIKSEK